MKIHKLYYGLIALFFLLLSLLSNSPAPMQAQPGELDTQNTLLPAKVQRSGTISDTLLIYGVELSPGYSQYAQPGSTITYTHILTNTGNVSDTFTLDVASAKNWPVALFNETSLTGTTRLPIALTPGLTATFQIDLEVPNQDISGTLVLSGSAVIGHIADIVVITATSQADPGAYATATDTAISPVEPQPLYLPLVGRTQRDLLALGADFGPKTSDAEILEFDMPLAKEMGANWIRIYLPWSYIEVSPGEYNWEPYDAVINRLVELELEPLPIIYFAPAWAAETCCGPISDTLALENFLEAALTRYGPYVNAWEFINEPDGKALNPKYGCILGCWGYHAEAYATQLEIFHDKVAALDPTAQVVFGGLAYDGWETFERHFFEQALQNGAGDFFDIANLHYYPINLKEFPTLAHKVNEIRSIMDRNGVLGKEIWVTETGQWVNDIGFPALNGSLEKQKNYIVREFTRAFAAGASNAFWFGIRERPVPEGVVHRWLISLNHEPINGYYTFQHYANKIEGASRVDAYPDVPANVEAYKFAVLGRSLFILWSNSGVQTVTFPAPTHAILTERDGKSYSVIPVKNGRVTFEIGEQPMFLEFNAP